MPDADISLQGIQGFFMKYLADKPHVFVPGDISFRAICVTDGNTAGFLSAVLQSRKPVVDRRGSGAAIGIINPEDAAFLFQFILLFRIKKLILKCPFRLF